MTGKYSGEKLIIELDRNFEKIEGPKNENGERTHYLPCDTCGNVDKVAWNVVAYECCWCHDKRLEYEDHLRGWE